MRWLSWFTSVFGGGDAEAIKLDASSEVALAKSLMQLAPSQRGWISMKEGRRLFSLMDEDDSQALTARDPKGLHALGEFAASSNHRSTPHRKVTVYLLLGREIRTLRPGGPGHRSCEHPRV
jgi:hypothetical protein